MSQAGPSTPSQFPLRASPRSAPATVTTPVRSFTPFKPSIVSSLRKEVQPGDGFEVASKPKKSKSAKAAAAASASATEDKGVDGEGKDESGLLLPEHVSIFEDAPVAEGEEAGDEIVLEAEDYEGVQFIDDDISKGTSRYFAPTTDEDHPDQRRVCRSCKQPGHIAKDCTKVICLTCGAEDEHESRDCPVALVCFGCGGRGHRKMECPDSRYRYAHRQGCDRCGSGEHLAMNCPTLWRIYVYVSKEERNRALDQADKAKGWEKEAVADSKMSQDEWCYNCARRGHFGDNCPSRRESFKKLVEPSAFSSHYAHHGPFASSHSKSRRHRERERSRSPPRRRDYDYDHTPTSDLPYVAEPFGGSSAGQRGKEKHRQQMRELESRTETDDTDTDGNWFAGQGQPGPNRKNGKGRQPSPPRMPHSLPPKPVIRFGQISAPSGVEDSPSAGKKKTGGSLLRQAVASASRSPAQNDRPMLRENDSSRSAPREGSREGSTSKANRRRNRARSNATETEGERDYESEWRREGGGGGNVQNWGRDYDREDMERRRAEERAHQVQPRGHQRYRGGY